MLWSELIKKHQLSSIVWIVFFAATACLEISFTARWANDLFRVGYRPYVACALFVGSVAFIAWAVKFNSTLHALPSAIIGAIKTGCMMTFPLYLLHQVIGGALMGAMVIHGMNRWSALGVTVFSMLLLTWVIAKVAEPRLQKVTKYILTTVHDRYRSKRFKLAK